MSDLPDMFRYCVHCGADCQEDEPDHTDTCPSVTGVWPIRVEDQLLCPHCGKDIRHPILCMDCGAPMNVGDCYMLRDGDTGQLVIKPEHMGIGEVICIGCAAQIDAGLVP